MVPSALAVVEGADFPINVVEIRFDLLHIVADAVAVTAIAEGAMNMGETVVSLGNFLVDVTIGTKVATLSGNPIVEGIDLANGVFGAAIAIIVVASESRSMHGEKTDDYGDGENELFHTTQYRSRMRLRMGPTTRW